MEKLTAEEIQIRARKRAKNIARMMGTSDGLQLLDALEDQFGSGPLVQDDAHKTAIKAAQYDVILWIKEVIKRGNDL